MKITSKEKGIITYIILTCILGGFTILAIPYAMSHKSYLYYGFVIIFLFCTILSGVSLKRYQKTVKYFDLGQYLTSQQEEFARIIHDEIIQDLYGIINNLSLKTPDVGKAKIVAENLEIKSRTIMTYYREHLLSDMTLEENIESIFYDVASLYPGQKIDMTYHISEKILENKISFDLKKTILIISKELINNIYKHSKATYINYKLTTCDGKIYLKVTSDGANEIDYKNILESRGGVLFMKFLLDSNGGHMEYYINKDVLTTEVRLGDE